jgi:site-specific recombinase XerD
MIEDYSDAAGHNGQPDSALFRPVRNNLTGDLSDAMTPHRVYLSVVRRYAGQLEFEGPRLEPHALCATAATNALENAADIVKVQEWLVHANIATTRVYDRPASRPENSPTF